MAQCLTFKSIFGEKHKAWEILFQEGAANINNLRFLKHDDRRKAYAMMVSYCEMEIEGDE